MIKTERVNFASIIHLTSHPKILFFTCLCQVLVIYLGAYRLKKLLIINLPAENKLINAKSGLSQMKMLSLQWIGLFFSTFLPGAVTGDVIKVGYIQSHTQRQLSYGKIATITILDRVMGLFALLFVGGILSTVFQNRLLEITNKIRPIIAINQLLLLGMSVGICIALYVLNLKEKHKSFILKFVPEKIFFLKLRGSLDGVLKINIPIGQFLKLMLPSIIVHLFSMAIFYMINISSYEKNLNWFELTTIIPLGQLAVAVPLTPAGLGVGHVAFENLFRMIHHENGAALFHNFWFFTVIINMLGIIPFLFLKKSEKTHK